MFKKINSKILLVIFFVLLAIVVVIKVGDIGKKDSTFRKEIATVDTAKVSEITIYQHTREKDKKEITLQKENKRWFVKHKQIKAAADENMIQSILQSLTELKTERPVAKSEEKWAEYKVTDTASTRIVVKENDKKTADFLIGKFTPHQQNNMYGGRGRGQQGYSFTTYLRCTGEPHIYAVEGMLGMMFNRAFNDFRDKTMLDIDKKNIRKLAFSYQADSSFTLLKNQTEWLLNDMPVDSAKTDGYLNSIQKMMNSHFMDNIKPGDLGSPLYELQIDGNNMAQVTIKAYKADSLNNYYMHSSLNPEVIFADKQNTQVNKLFVPQSEFMQKTEDKEKL